MDEESLQAVLSEPRVEISRALERGAERAVEREQPDDSDEEEEREEGDDDRHGLELSADR